MMEAFSTVAPASRRLSRGHPALAGGGGTPPLPAPSLPKSQPPGGGATALTLRCAKQKLYKLMTRCWQTPRPLRS